MKHVFTPDEQISCLSGIFFVTGGFMVEERTLKTAAKERIVMDFLKETDVFDNATKRYYGII